MLSSSNRPFWLARTLTFTAQLAPVKPSISDLKPRATSSILAASAPVTVLEGLNLPVPSPATMPRVVQYSMYAAAQWPTVSV